MKINNELYKDYFKQHYNSSFTKNDMKIQGKFLFSYLKFIDQKINVSSYQNKKILEIGSGQGAVAKLLLEKWNFKCYGGIEIDKDMAEFCNKNIGNYFKNVNIETFSESAEKYDLIFAFEVLEHLSDPRKTISIVKDLLLEAGVFVASSPFPFKKNVLADYTHLYVLHPENWKKLFHEAGFKKINTYPMSNLPFLWRINHKLNFRIPFYIPFNYFISTTLIIAFK